MSPKQLDNEIKEMISQGTIKMLSGIKHLAVCHFASDAGSASREGALLIAVSKVDNDTDGDGFRYLIGLPEGATITPHLTSFF